jgi:hypothetical protein
MYSVQRRALLLTVMNNGILLLKIATNANDLEQIKDIPRVQHAALSLT